MPNLLAGEKKSFSRLVIEGGGEIGVGGMGDFHKWWNGYGRKNAEAWKDDEFDIHWMNDAATNAYKAGYDAGVRAGGGSGGVKRDDLTMDRSDFSGGGVKVLKKGDAGHGGGKKRRRY
jgi:hypothetical protein|tara:strand:+ start:81 stop:434 length:354 start_codon:yes stop_codon:yes gene_type:complete